MPIYYVHVRSGDKQYKDMQGRDLKSLIAVRDYAIELLMKIAQGHPPRDIHAVEHDFDVVVEDTEGAVVYEARLDFSARWSKPPWTPTLVK